MEKIRVDGKNLYRAKPQGLMLEGICGGRGRGEAHRLTPARPSTRAHHTIFPSWTTHGTDHALSERGNGSKHQRTSVARPSFSTHRAGVLGANAHGQPDAPQMVVPTDLERKCKAVREIVRPEQPHGTPLACRAAARVPPESGWSLGGHSRGCRETVAFPNQP